ncbi:MAG: glycosyltransferase family 1 protein, partial [Acidobacteriota bacterium]|nr:glycosyltransferase family 1 protein [Acidobacteriota bacterium]
MVRSSQQSSSASDKKRILIATVHVPFKWYPPEKILDHMLACRLLDLTEVAGTPVDLLIGLRFPAYL